MNIEQVREYTLSLPGVTEDQPFGDDIITFRLEGKIFVCLWLGDGKHDIKNSEPRLALKLSPERNEEIREQFSAVTPAWHWNKKHWSDVYYEQIEDVLVQEWIRESYRLIVSKLPKSSSLRHWALAAIQPLLLTMVFCGIMTSLISCANNDYQIKPQDEYKDKTISYMKKKISWVLAATLFCGTSVFPACSSDDDDNTTPDTTPLVEWQAGKTVSDKAVVAYGGIDKCFAAEPIPDGVWQRMQGKTFKKNPYIQREDLRHVRALHWDYDNQMHVGEMIVNKEIAERVARILHQLFDAKYPIQRMLLPDVYDADDETQMRDNNSSCFCYRTIAGSTKLSKHARGLAIDINTLYNPYYRDLDNGTRFIQPATAEAYCDRTWDFPYKIDHEDLCFRLFTEAGFEWGGDWTTRKDFQHFELVE